MNRAQLESKSNDELLEMQKNVWTIGADDDHERIAECTPITTDAERAEVINFLLEVDSNGGWKDNDDIADELSQDADTDENSKEPRHDDQRR